MKTQLVTIMIAAGIASAVIYLAVSSYSDAYGKNVFCAEDFMMTALGKCRPGGPISIVDEPHDSRLVLTVGEPIDHHGLVPIITTQITTSSEPITKIIDRTYHPTNFGNRTVDSLGTSWELVPGHMRISMQVLDQNNTDAIDRSDNPSFSRTQPLYTTRITCDNNQTVEILYGTSVIVPIKNGIHTVYDRNLVDGLLPNNNNQYVLSFASFFKQDIELPDTAIIQSQTSKTCHTGIKNHETTHYDRVVFEMENPIKDYVPPVLHFETDKKSYVKNDTVVVSGSVSRILSHDELILQVMGPQGSIIDLNLIDIDENGKFTKNIMTDRPLWNQNGTYVIKLQYGKDVLEEKEIMLTIS